MTITAAQLTRLQTLYAQYEQKSLDASQGRAGRIAWAMHATGRALDSFSDLTAIEAKRLIDALQGQLGTKHPNQSPRRDVEPRARKQMGTAGRHDGDKDEITLASPRDLYRIDLDVEALGWTAERLTAFLTKRKTLKGRTEIRTLADANKVHWALQSIIRRQRKAS